MFIYSLFSGNFIHKSATFANMVENRWILKAQESLLYIFAFVIPLPFIFSPFVIVSMIYLWLIAGNYKNTFRNIKTRKILWPWFAFFLINLISYLYSINKSQSLFDIQQKISFFLLPVIIGSGISINKDILERIFLSFIISVSLVAIICMSRAVVIWHNSHTTYQFFYHSLVSKLDANAVYYAWYAIFAISIILFFPWRSFFLGNNKFLKYIFLPIILLFFIILSARTLTLLFFAIIIPLYLHKLTKNNKGALIRASILVIIIGLCIAIFNTSNPIKKRYVELINDKQQNYIPRFILWKIGIEIINENHLWIKGAGNGDYQDLHNEKVNKHVSENQNAANNWADLYGFNLHNTYLQTIAMIGIIGLIPLLFMLFLPYFYISRINISYLYFIFNLLACVFLFQECAFQTQAGVIFYSFFSLIFWNYYYSQRPLTNVKNLSIST